MDQQVEPNLKKQAANYLASTYTPGKRRLEKVSLVIFVILCSYSLYNTYNHLNLNTAPLAIVACIWAMFAADFFSGIVHWGCDTWGTIDTPIFANFIRSFREHHVDPTAITRHDIIETNGDNCLLTIPILLLITITKINLQEPLEYFLYSFMFLLCFWVAITNQIHKWSHTLKPSSVVQIFQDLYIILGRKHHGIHHKSPHDRYYCITNGWLNYFF